MDQIGSTLDLIKRKLDQYLCNRYAQQAEYVIVSNIVQDDGSVYESTKNKIVIFLANIQHETTISTYNKNVPTSNNTYVTVAPALYINLFVLFYANFSDANYRQGLSFISDTISFFQQTPCFTKDNSPDLEPVIDKLTFDMVNLDASELNYLVGLAGVKYLPCVYYKIRMLPFISDEIQGTTAGVQGLQNQPVPDDAEDDS
ncbi:MAG: hypothetical protein ACI936_002728 [Paraglaciecola sp.]|jgi:hypothetical protein